MCVDEQALRAWEERHTDTFDDYHAADGRYEDGATCPLVHGGQRWEDIEGRAWQVDLVIPDEGLAVISRVRPDGGEDVETVAISDLLVNYDRVR